MAISALFFADVAIAESNAGAKIGYVVIISIIVAFGYLSWRRPGRVGRLLLVFVPVGFFAVLFGSTNLDPASQVILGVVWMAGLPLASAILLILASRRSTACGADGGRARALARGSAPTPGTRAPGDPF